MTSDDLFAPDRIEQQIAFPGDVLACTGLCVEVQQLPIRGGPISRPAWETGAVRVPSFRKVRPVLLHLLTQGLIFGCPLEISQQMVTTEDIGNFAGMICRIAVRMEWVCRDHLIEPVPIDRLLARCG